MAVDEAISRAVAEGSAPPTLRFYAWQPPCISLGRHQPLAVLDRDRVRALGYGIVRRPTGGRAILHTDELTYSLAAPPEHPLLAGMVLESYLRLSAGLVAGLAGLGIRAEPAPGASRPGPNVSAACFEAPSAYEIVAEGRKLLGSAQSRRARVVLQHGSLPLYGDLTRLIDCLALPSTAEREALRRSLAEHATTVEQITGRRISLDSALDALCAGFASALRMELAPGALSEAETAWTAELVREKYDNPEWTGRA